MIRNAVCGQRHALVSAYLFAVFYLFVSALLVFNVEPETFNTFWDALYWAAVSLTTVGYGDIYPVTALGRLVGTVIAFSGLAAVAIPTGIISSGLMEHYYSQDKGTDGIAKNKICEPERDRLAQEQIELLRDLSEKIVRLEKTTSKR